MEESNILSEKLQIKLQFKYTAWMYIIDQFIRLIFLILYIQNFYSFTIFLLIQIILIFLLIPLNNHYNKLLVKKYLPFINPKYKNENPELTFDENVPQKLVIYQLLFGFIFSFWIIYHCTNITNWYYYIYIFIFSFFGMILCLVPLYGTIRYNQSAGIFSAIAQKKKEFKTKDFVYEDVSKTYPDIFTSDKLISYGLIEFDTVDANDVRIAKIESEVKNINYRAEAWMLESVFLGGLAFSGFLTVASANFIGREPVIFKNFLNHINNYYDKCNFSNLMSWFTEIDIQFFRNDLYILIMLLCLLSSVFFFLVLLLRLRLSSLALKMDYLIRILTIFNSKEEELFNLKFDKDSEIFQNRRLEKIQKKIEATLIDAEKLLKELQPTSNMMNVYRTVAVFLFYLVLVVSGFYFMFVISVLILFLFLFTQLFGLFEKYTKLDRIKNLLRKH